MHTSPASTPIGADAGAAVAAAAAQNGYIEYEKRVGDKRVAIIRSANPNTEERLQATRHTTPQNPVKTPALSTQQSLCVNAMRHFADGGARIVVIVGAVYAIVRTFTCKHRTQCAIKLDLYEAIVRVPSVDGSRGGGVAACLGVTSTIAGGMVRGRLGAGVSVVERKFTHTDNAAAAAAAASSGEIDTRRWEVRRRTARALPTREAIALRLAKFKSIYVLCV